MPFTRTLTTTPVYRRLPARDALRIQHLAPDLHDAAIELLKTYFTKDEPPCRCIGLTNYPSAMMELEKLWRKALRENVSLACVVDDESQPPRIVGLNILAVICADDKDEPFQTDDKIWAQLYGAVDLVSRSVDVFQQFGVDKYLTAYGLVVHPQFRRMGVAQEILKTRINLCRSLGIKVTVTVFTAKGSQLAAKKAGFVDLFEITYEELAEKGFVFPGVEHDTKSSKLMALVID